MDVLCWEEADAERETTGDVEVVVADAAMAPLQFTQKNKKISSYAHTNINTQQIRAHAITYQARIYKHSRAHT